MANPIKTKTLRGTRVRFTCDNCGKQCEWKLSKYEGAYGKKRRHACSPECRHVLHRTNADTYIKVSVNGRPTRVHRIVMEKKIGRRLTRHEVVHHKNGDPHDNRLSNLEIMTQSEHARIHGHQHRKYDWETVAKEKRKGRSPAEASRMLGIPYHTTYRIFRRLHD